MTARDKSSAEVFTRGGDVFRHKLNMFVASVAWTGGIALVVACAVFFLSMVTISSSPQLQLWRYYTVATTAHKVGIGDLPLLKQRVVIGDADLGSKTPNQIIIEQTGTYNEFVAGRVQVSLFVALAAFALAAFAVIRFYLKIGRTAGQDEFRRGTTLVTANELSRAVTETTPGAGSYKLAGVPIPKGMEMRNILCTGAMGSGKSVAILGLADQVISAGKKMVIYDKVGEFAESYFRPGKDFILNPFDSRDAHWNVFGEIDKTYEFEQIAHSLIPLPDNANGTEKYFLEGARTVFHCILEKLYHEGRCNMDAVAEVLAWQYKQLAEYVAGTEAGAYVPCEGGGDQGAGVQSTLMQAVKVLKHVPAGDFSIKRWVTEGPQDSRLFITSHESVHAILLPLITMYTDIAIRAAMAGERHREDKLWIFLDELASLRSLPILKDSLTEARKYGVVHVIGLQNVAQLKQNFGDNIAQVLRSNLQNYLVLRVADEDTQESYSKLLGSKEIDENNESLSFGANSSKDGSGVQTARREMRIVMPSELKLLRDCEGYLQMAGPYPLAKVEFAPKHRDKIAAGYEPRPELELRRRETTTSGPASPVVPATDVNDISYLFEPLPSATQEPPLQVSAAPEVASGEAKDPQALVELAERIGPNHVEAEKTEERESVMDFAGGDATEQLAEVTTAVKATPKRRSRV